MSMVLNGLRRKRAQLLPFVVLLKEGSFYEQKMDLKSGCRHVTNFPIVKIVGCGKRGTLTSGMNYFCLGEKKLKNEKISE